MSELFNSFFYRPLYNGFIALFDFLPWFDAGMVVVLFTILVKFILHPLSKKAVLAQMEMKNLEPELGKVRDKYKNDRQEQARQTMELYRTRKINPFSSIFLILIQLPIIFALYFIFLKSGLPQINGSLLYSFVPTPESVDMNFLGLIDIAKKSYVLAILAGISTFFQTRLSTPAYKSNDKERSFRSDLARSMSLQMRYFFPVLVFFISYNISGAVALYWFTSNLFTIVQELVIRRKFTGRSVEVPRV